MALKVARDLEILQERLQFSHHQTLDEKELFQKQVILVPLTLERFPEHLLLVLLLILLQLRMEAGVG